MPTTNDTLCSSLILFLLVGCGTADDKQSPLQVADAAVAVADAAVADAAAADVQSADTQAPALDTQQLVADTALVDSATSDDDASAPMDTSMADSGPSLDTTTADASPDTNSGSSVVAKAAVPQGYFQLVDPLDEPEFYCLDIPGYKSSLKLDSPLMMHTCKQKKGVDGDDELFAWNQPKSGQIQAYKYDRCAQASSTNAGTTVILKTCSDSKLQQWVITTKGQIRLANSGLCMAAEVAAGTVAGGNSNMRRDMRLELCDTVDPKLAIWTFPGT